MKKGLILSLLLIVSSVIALSFTFKNKVENKEMKIGQSSSFTGITCRSWCSHENTYAELAALYAWDNQMQAESPQVPRGEDTWTVGCGVGSAPGCAMGTCTQICYGSFP